MEERADGPDPAPGLAEALDSLSTGCLRCDAEGRVLAMNAAGATLLGLTRDDEGGDLMLPSLLPGPGDWARLRTREPDTGNPGAYRTSLLTTDGNRLPCLMDLLELAGNDGRAAGFYVLFRRTGPAEDRIRALEEANERAHRMTQFQDRLINALAHDLKTPPVVMLGFSELLLRGRYGRLSPEQEKPLQTIHRNVGALVGMVESVLVFTRLIVTLPGEREPVALRPLWSEALGGLGGEADSPADRFTMEDTGEGDSFPCNRAALSFLLANLASNTLCMMGESCTARCRTTLGEGALTLLVEMPRLRPDLPSLSRLMEGLFCEVKASPSDEVRRVLGLAPGRYVAAAIGGSLEAQLLPPDGARLIVSLPRF